jgi:hypothetical protein
MAGLPKEDYLVRRENRIFCLAYLLHCTVAMQHNKFEFWSRRWSDPGLTAEFRVQGPEKGPSGPYVSQT